MTSDLGKTQQLKNFLYQILLKWSIQRTQHPQLLKNLLYIIKWEIKAGNEYSLQHFTPPRNLADFRTYKGCMLVLSESKSQPKLYNPKC